MGKEAATQKYPSCARKGFARAGKQCMHTIPKPTPALDLWGRNVVQILMGWTAPTTSRMGVSLVHFARKRAELCPGGVPVSPTTWSRMKGLAVQIQRLVKW